MNRPHRAQSRGVAFGFTIVVADPQPPGERPAGRQRWQGQQSWPSGPSGPSWPFRQGRQARQARKSTGIFLAKNTQTRLGRQEPWLERFSALGRTTLRPPSRSHGQGAFLTLGRASWHPTPPCTVGMCRTRGGRAVGPASVKTGATQAQLRSGSLRDSLLASGRSSSRERQFLAAAGSCGGHAGRRANRAGARVRRTGKPVAVGAGYRVTCAWELRKQRLLRSDQAWAVGGSTRRGLCVTFAAPGA
jgi:hypothetical protein